MYLAVELFNLGTYFFDIMCFAKEKCIKISRNGDARSPERIQKLNDGEPKIWLFS